MNRTTRALERLVAAGHTLLARLAAVAAILAVEILVLSFLVQGRHGIYVHGAEAVLRDVQHWLFRFLIAYAAALSMFALLTERSALRRELLAPCSAPLRLRWAPVHLLAFLPLAGLSRILYHGDGAWPFAPVAIAWHLAALGTGLALLAVFAPARTWLSLWRADARLALFAIVPAAVAVALIPWSQALWAPAADLNFRLVVGMLRPFYPGLQVDPASMTLATDRFEVTISAVCSGYEGVGLMLAFCAGWLWLFRRDYRFPRALWIVPLGVATIFVLNAARIAALLVIGDAGAPRIAQIGFHSQAGWIEFNLTAFAVALLAKNLRWLHRQTEAPAASRRQDNPPAPYLVPLLAILAAGMLARAASAGFEWLYGLRVMAATAALLAYRRRYRELDWRCSPLLAAAAGVLVFLVWTLAARGLLPASAMPASLAAAPRSWRLVWILTRIAGALITVPIAEELAFRGYLMRRLANEDFDALAYRRVRWPQVAVSAVLFGLMHGPMWPAGIAAGLVFGAIAVRTDRLGNAILAHSIANALIVVAVLAGGQWSYW